MLRNPFAALVRRNKRSELFTLFLQHRGDSAKRGYAKLFDAIVEELCRDVNAVEYVTYVVQHAGGDFGHARLAPRAHKILVSLLQRGLCCDKVGDIENRPHQTPYHN